MDWCEWFGFEFDPFFDKPLESEDEIKTLMVIEKKLEEQIYPLIRQMKKVSFLCLVCGERGIGKSTFLYYANGLSEKSNILPVYVALDNTQIEFSKKPPYELQRSLMYEFGVKLLESIDKLKKKFFDSNKVTFFELARYLGLTYQESVGFVPAREHFRIELFELKRFILTVVKLLKNAGTPIILSVDNLDRISDPQVLETFFMAPGAQSIFDEFRKEGVSILIAMSNDFAKLQKQRRNLNYLNQTINLYALSPPQVLELVEKRIANSNQPPPSNPFDQKALFSISINKKGITREILTEARSICSKAYEQKILRITEEFAIKGLSSFDESRAFYEIVEKNDAIKVAALNLCELASHSKIPVEEAIKNIRGLESKGSPSIKSEFLIKLVDLKLVQFTDSGEYTLTQSVSELFEAVKKRNWEINNFLAWIFTKESLKIIVNGIPGSGLVPAITAFGPIPRPIGKTVNIIVSNQQETFQTAQLFNDAIEGLERAKQIAIRVGKLSWDDIDNEEVFRQVYWALSDFLASFSKLYICCASYNIIRIKSWKNDDFFENVIHHFQEEYGVTFKSFYRFQHFNANYHGFVRGAFTPSHSHITVAFDDFVQIVQEFSKMWQNISSKFSALDIPDKGNDDILKSSLQFSLILGFTNDRPKFKRFEINGEEYFKLGFSKFPINEATVDIVTEKTITNRLGTLMSSYFISSINPNSKTRATEKDVLSFIRKTWDLTQKIKNYCKDFEVAEGFPKFLLLYISNSGFEPGIRAVLRTAELPPNSQILTFDSHGLQSQLYQLKSPFKMLSSDNGEASNISKKNLESLLGLRLKITEVIHEKFEKITTILLADLENFTHRTEADRLESAETVVKMSEIFRQEIELYGGSGTNAEGDSYIAFFDKADQAVQAALKAVEKINDYNSKIPEQKQIRVHIGLSTGEILFNNGRPFIGDAINIASRIMKKLESNKVVISEATYKEISGYRGFSFTEKGSEELKGIAKPIKIYEVELKQIVDLIPTSNKT